MNRWLSAIVVAAAYFAAVAPTLTWLEFSNGIENLNIETAMEMRRGGPWVIPTLWQQPRVRKPPLTAWITAWSVRPGTVQMMSSRDPAVREAAWKELAWQVRWPALVAAAITLALCCELGATILGESRGGVFAGLIAGSTLLFLRYSHSATTDVHLALWVTAANLCLAKWIFERRVWVGLIGAGIALGLGMMSKGPVTFVMTVAPVGAYLAWECFAKVGPLGASYPGLKARLGGAAIGLVLMLAIGFSWFVYAMQSHPSQQRVWWMEVLRTDPSEAATSRWYGYITLLPQLMPWMPMVLAGLWMTAVAMRRAWVGSLDEAHREAAKRLVFAALLLVVPILIMSFFRDRKVRYLYPFAIPAGILAAGALLEISRMGRRGFGGALVWIHWIIVATIAIGLPLSGMLGTVGMMKLDGTPWYSAAVGITCALVAAIWLLAMFQLRSAGVIVVGSAVILWATQALYVYGNRLSPSGDGASEMLPLARALWDEYPDVTPYNVSDGRKQIPPDLAIYMNRPLQKARGVGQIPQSPNSQLHVVLQKRDAPEPPAEAGWFMFMKVPRDRDWWVAFVREGQGH